MWLKVSAKSDETADEIVSLLKVTYKWFKALANSDENAIKIVSQLKVMYKWLKVLAKIMKMLLN